MGVAGGFASRLPSAIFFSMFRLPRFRSSHIATFLLALVALACSGGTPRGPRLAPTPVPVADPVDPLASPWVVRRTGARVAQTIRIDATIDASVDSLTPALVDTMQSELTAEWSVPTTGFPQRYVGSVTAYRVANAADSALLPQGLAVPFAFTAEQRTPGQQPTFTTPDGASCDAPHAVIVHGVRDLWLSLPDTLVTGQTWQDSGRYVVCRDSIPLQTEVERTFRVTGAMRRGRAVIVTVERRTMTRFAGTGTQFGEPVSISGTGTGAVMLEVALEDGIIVFASGDSELQVTLRGRRRTQEVTQRSRIAIFGR